MLRIGVVAWICLYGYIKLAATWTIGRNDGRVIGRSLLERWRFCRAGVANHIRHLLAVTNIS